MDGGNRFTKGRLFRLLTNPIYIGKVAFKEQVYDGEHEAIVEPTIWERVQQILRRNGRNGGAEARDVYGVVLKGLLRCTSCNAGMIRTYTISNSRRIRHFVCTQGHQSGHTRAISEAAIKETVVKQIRTIGSDARIVASTMAKVEQQRQANIADLHLEREVAQRALADMGKQLHKQPVAGTVAPEERIGQTERRVKELSLELARLQRQSVEEGDLRMTLSQFDPVWESLNSREQTRIISALIVGIEYNGETKKVSVSFRSRGIRGMCRGTAKGSRN